MVDVPVYWPGAAEGAMAMSKISPENVLPALPAGVSESGALAKRLVSIMLSSASTLKQMVFRNNSALPVLRRPATRVSVSPAGRFARATRT